MEGKDAIGAMLGETLAGVGPGAWQISGEANEAGGVTDAWITFETAVSRGKGHIRLKGDKCWTLLTSMTELKGHEERPWLWQIGHQPGQRGGIRMEGVGAGRRQLPSVGGKFGMLLPSQNGAAEHDAVLLHSVLQRLEMMATADFSQ